MQGRLRTILAITFVALLAIGGPSAQEVPGGQMPVRADQSAVPVAPAVQTPEAPAEPSVTVLGSWQAQGVLGREVRSSAGENMGRIVDVIVDRGGHVHAAIIDFGGFLGVGSRKIAVDWRALRFRPDSAKRDIITLELNRDQVKAAPEYKDKQPVVVLGASGGLQSLPSD
ncbi:MAG: PRC-barrel domain containing protein [Rhizobiales bacterium]|nr:PRC-barrel domain containing protein [Hyphomicrobiales bacterium]